MGYTHAAVGAAGAIALAACTGDYSPELYLLAVVGGTLGGVAIDIDTKDCVSGPNVTDAGRSRIAAAILTGVAIALDFILKYGILLSIIQRRYTALGGLIAFAVLLLIGYATEHRTFSHSLLFIILTSICIYCIIPSLTPYYAFGCLLHIQLDMLNHKYCNHGIWLFYPIKIGAGIALGWCKAARAGNKIFYFLGVGEAAAATYFYLYQNQDLMNVLPAVLLLLSLILLLHFVRVKSEREQRHIMHITGEL